MGIVEIREIGDPALDVYARLTEAQLKSRVRPEDGLFIAESPVVIGYALGSLTARDEGRYRKSQ